MNPLQPLADIVKAVTFPFKALFVIMVCAGINWFTTPHHWWVQWVVFGMIIATLVIWLRALRAIIAAVGIAGAAYLIHRWWTGRSNRPLDSRTIDAGHF
jgi:hypothetical protein